MAAGRRYPLPEKLARHAGGKDFPSDELRRACQKAGEGLGRADARRARFRSAAEMVGMWRGLDLPAWKAPYILRDTRLGYLSSYEKSLVSDEISDQKTIRAAKARWGENWRQKLESARNRQKTDG